MNNLEEFLTSLTDHELSKFIGYRYEDFLENSKNKIFLEAKKRKLDKFQLIELFKKPFESISGKENCPNCGSDRLYVETDYDVKTIGKFNSVEVAIDTKRCLICNYNPLKRKPKNLLDRIKIICHKKSNERIINWNFW